MKLLSKLENGDLRSIGKANEVVKQIGNSQNLFDEVFQGIFETNPLIRMRASDTIKKVSHNYLGLLKKHKKKILSHLQHFKQQEVKWHIALMVSYLTLTKKEAETAFTEFSQWIKKDDSRIVKVNALQVLATIAAKHPTLKTKIIALIKKFWKTILVMVFYEILARVGLIKKRGKRHETNQKFLCFSDHFFFFNG